jgi:anti-anti-sigma factor
MEITVAQESGVTLIRMSGSLDSLTCDEAQAVFDERIKNNQIKLVVDLSQVDYLSSAGMRVLLPALKSARQRGGDLYLVGLQENIRKVLSLAGFASIFKTFATFEDAVGSFASR